MSDPNTDFPLDLLPYARELRRRVSAAGQAEVWCQVRRRFVVLQPEELVRQAAIAYLRQLGYPVNLMQLERGVPGTRNRLDLLVLDRSAAPFLLLEAKRPDVHHGEGIAQLADYRRAVAARYVLSVNGVRAVCMEVDEAAQTVRTLGAVPAFSSL